MKQTKTIEDLYKTNPVLACRKALRKTQHLRGEERLEECNRLLRGCGVEAIRGDYGNSCWQDIVADYVNMGDTYDTTILRVRGKGFIVLSWGDFVERYSKEYGIY